MSLDVDARHMSIAERVHGGVFFADTAMGSAVASTRKRVGAARPSRQINYFRPVQQGRSASSLAA